VVEPMPRFASNYKSVDLVCFDPNKFIDSLISPFDETLPAKLHSPASHPQEDETLLLEDIDSQI
jgi:hypothetical protein